MRERGTDIFEGERIDFRKRNVGIKVQILKRSEKNCAKVS